MDDAWEKFKRRGEAIERYNREHLEKLTLEEAIRDMESLLPLLTRFDVERTHDPLPVSLARLIGQRSNGGR